MRLAISYRVNNDEEVFQEERNVTRHNSEWVWKVVRNFVRTHPSWERAQLRGLERIHHHGDPVHCYEATFAVPNSGDNQKELVIVLRYSYALEQSS